MNNCIDCHSENITPAYIRFPKGANISKPLGNRLVKPNDSYYVIFRCENCGSIFLHPFYWEESFSVYTDERYFSGYFPNNIHRGGGPPSTYEPPFPEYSRWRQRRKAQRLLRIADCSHFSSPRVCDIGCASGLLVRAFKDIGCAAYGAEISNQAIEAQNYGLNVYHGKFEEACYQDEFFDVVIALDVFEHMASLDEIMAEIVRTLKTTGVFLCRVPNDIESYRTYAYRKIWWMIPPMHIRYFTLCSARNIFGRHRLVLSRYSTDGSVGGDMAMILKWLAGKLGMEKLTGSLPWMIMTKARSIALYPVDLMLNMVKKHSELVLVFQKDIVKRMPVRIIYIDSLHNYGGGQKHLLNILKQIDRDKFVPYVACSTKCPLADRLREINVPVIPVELVGKFQLGAIIRLALLMCQHRPDIVHSEDSLSRLLGTIAARLAGVPIVVSTVHKVNVSPVVRDMSNSRRKIYVLVTRLLAKLSDKWFTVAEFNKQELMQLVKIPAHKIAVIHSSIVLDEFDIEVDTERKRKEFGLQANAPVVGTIARLHPDKGVRYLLDAAVTVLEEVPDVKFMLVGDGIQRVELESIAKQNGIAENVIFAGFRDDVAELYSLFTITVLPSLNEGLPVVPMESLYMGKPVVATDVCGNPEIVRHGETGLIVPTKDSESLAQAILTLLNDEPKANPMAVCGRELVEKEFSNSVMVNRYEQAYETLIHQKINNGRTM